MIVPDYKDIKTKNELYHYGMPRRSGRYPWGSGDRPYQSIKDSLKGKGRSDYFTSERTIPKGTKMYTVTSSNLQSGGLINVAYLGPDRDRKIGYSKRRISDDVYEHTMVLNKELKIPSRDIFIKSIDDVIKNNPKLFKESFDAYIDLWYSRPVREHIAWDEKSGKIDMSKWDKYVKNRYKEALDEPITESWGRIVFALDKSTNLKEAIIDDLKKKGYNAMVDEYAVGSNNLLWKRTDGLDPLIVFDSSVLNEVKSEKIKRKQETQAQNNYKDWAIKTNENMMRLERMQKKESDLRN